MANFKILAGISIVIGLVGLIFLSLLYSLTGGDIPFDYGVIVDAGSSHSEALLYHWRGDKYKGTGYVDQKDNCNVDVGISSFANPDDAGESLLPCLQQMASVVPEDKRAITPVYLAATAGMRLLNISNPYLNLATFTAIKCAIPSSGLQREEVGIISGQDEGIFAWITSNFLLGNLQSRLHTTIGALDMGGASTQISFEVLEQFQNTSGVKTLSLYGGKYHVFSVSYLCYGAFEIYRRYLATIVNNPEGPVEIDSPCHHKGWTETFTADFLFNQPCTTTQYLRQWVFLNQDKLNKTYKVKGISDSDACKVKMLELFDPIKCKENYEECLQPIDSSIMPEKYMAFSSYFYTTDFVNSTNTSLEDYRDRVKTFCLKTWADVNTKNFSSSVKKVLPRFCMQGHAVDVILTIGFNFNESSWSNIEFTSNIKGNSVGWALGYMINSTNAIPEESVEPSAISTTVFIILIILCGLLLVLGLFFCTKSKKQNKTSRTMP